MHILKLGARLTSSVLIAASTLTPSWAAADAVGPPKIDLAQACFEGQTPIPSGPLRIEPDGGHSYLYTTPTGESFTQLMPPTSFDPLKASDDALIRYGYTPRPVDPVELDAWLAEAGGYRQAADEAPIFCKMPRPDPFAAIPSTHTATTFWSGEENTVGGYQRAVGDFIQPSVTNTTNSSMLNWVGLTGSGSKHVLIQAGTVNEPGNPSVGYPFWELYCTWSPSCNGYQPDKRYTATHGTHVSISVSYNPATHLSYYHVRFNNVLRINVQYLIPAGSVSGASALYIGERVLGPPQRNLPTFALMQWLNLRTFPVWNQSTYTYFGDQAHTNIEMSKNGTFYTVPPCTNANILMYPTQQSRTGFYNVFCRAS
ncbi:G1 family glutamic endopeptidase [Nakamurella lactea]|uniref:G1 family glutamic endopeptidase n=1 Tax=Nakamurella lactea TaxID=459515 RepID=UPI0013781F0F|nr:G1 family glutamic endopeptidase [Nakamurella lactea]